MDYEAKTIKDVRQLAKLAAALLEVAGTMDHYANWENCEDIYKQATAAMFAIGEYYINSQVDIEDQIEKEKSDA